MVAILNLIIVDDEELEREGLRKCINWAALGIDVAGVYADSRNAYEAVKNCPPDILITDISMPFMNGLTLAEKVHDLAPQTKIIFVTGYEDFNYAKKAIDVNATKYILKPYEIEEIYNIIQQTVEQCTNEKSIAYEHEVLKMKLKESLPLLQVKFCTDMLYGLLQTQDSEAIKKQKNWLEIPLLDDAEYYVNIIEIDNFNALVQDENEYYQHVLALEIHGNIKNIVESHHGICINISNSIFAVILSFVPSESNTQYNYEFNERLLKSLNKNYNADITIGTGKHCKAISNIYIAYRQAQEALKQKFIFGTNQVIYFGDITSKDTIQMDILLEQIKHKILTLVERGDEAEIENQINLMFQVMSQNAVERLYIQNMCVDIINSLSKNLIRNGIDIDQLFGEGASLIGKLLRFDTIFNTQMWIKNVIVLISRHLNQQNNSRNSKIVEQMKNIIERRYAEDITVADIASEVFLSAGYATMLFKKETGESLMRYIIKTRIEAARGMLRDPNTKISEVAYNIGYSNLAYFTALFKSEIGISPKEYRDRYC